MVAHLARLVFVSLFFTCLFLWSGAPSWERQKVRYTQARAATHMLLLYLDFEHLESVSEMCYMVLSMNILLTRLIVGVCDAIRACLLTSSCSRCWTAQRYSRCDASAWKLRFKVELAVGRIAVTLSVLTLRTARCRFSHRKKCRHFFGLVHITERSLSLELSQRLPSLLLASH
jgi:hypothetical protein